MPDQDVEHELEMLRARVRAMENLVPPSPTLTPLQKAIVGVNTNWYISGKLPAPAANAPLTWRAVYLCKRIARRVMVELLNSLVEQQNRFNSDVARAVTELAQENAALRLRIEELERQRADEHPRL